MSNPTAQQQNYGVLKGIPSGEIDPGLEAQLLRDRNHDKLIQHSLWEAFFYLRECAKDYIKDDGQILSLCFSALTKAIKTYNPRNDSKTRFMGYAKPFLRGEAKASWRENQVVKIGSRKAHPKAFVSDDVLTINNNADGGENGRYDAAMPQADRVTWKKEFQPCVGHETSIEPEEDNSDKKRLFELFTKYAEEHLTDKALEVFKKRIIEGMTWDAISESMNNTSRQASQGLFKKAMKKLLESSSLPTEIRTLLQECKS